jgi:hypothetical protein
MNIAAYRLIDGHYKQTQFYTYYNKVHKIIKDTTEDVPKELLDYLDAYKTIDNNLRRILDILDQYSRQTPVDILTALLFINYNTSPFPGFTILNNLRNTENIQLMFERDVFYTSDIYKKDNMLFTNDPTNLDNITIYGVENYVKAVLNNNDIIVKQFGNMGITTYGELLQRYPKRDKLVLYFGKGSFLYLNKNQLFLTKDFIKYIQGLSVNTRIPGSFKFLMCYIIDTYKQQMQEKLDLLLYGELKNLCSETYEGHIKTDDVYRVIAKYIYSILNSLKEKCEKTSFLMKFNYKENFKRAYLLNIENRLEETERQLRHYEDNYQKYIKQKQNLLWEQVYVNEKVGKDFENFFNYMTMLTENNIIRDYDISIDNKYIEIKLKYDFLQIIYYDQELLERCINSKWGLDSTKKNELREVLNGNRKLWATPANVTINIDFNTKEYRVYHNKISVPFIVTNGHVEIPCYGTFTNVLKEAAFELNIAKFIAYYTQFLQSAAPVDAAGEKAFIRPLITDCDGNITYARNDDYTHDYKDYNILTEFDFDKNMFIKHKEEQNNANS